MRLALLADIHENLENLRHAVDASRRLGAEAFIVLGDVYETGRRIDETVAVLRAVGAVGVWGNHDAGLCFDVAEKTRQRYTPAVLGFMGGLRPRAEIDGCLFTHVEPWLDPNKVEDLWYCDGPPDTAEKLGRSFAAVSNRVMFTGRFHRWLVGSPPGVLSWNGERPVVLDPAARHLVVIHAVADGHCAVFDTATGELTPVRAKSAEPESGGSLP